MHRRHVLRTLSLGAVAATCLPSVSVGAPANETVSLTPNIHNASSADVWACWIGHSTVLLRICGSWVLTDPVLFGSYGAQFLGITLGPRRYIKPALSIKEIPKPDVIILSHAHMDHMDRKTLVHLSELYPKQIDVYTASYTSDVISDLDWKSLNEMDWGDRIDLGSFELTALRVRHNGWRWPGEACRAEGYMRGRSYNGYYLRCNNVGVVFGGDTAYTTHFKNVPGPVHLAIMPIGAYRGYRDHHCTPEESLGMVQMMKAERMMPIHYNTFCQSEEPRHEPLSRLRKAVAKQQGVQLTCLDIGSSLQIA